LIGDRDSEGFFRDLWNDEQHHGEELTQWLLDLGGGTSDRLNRATF
jgi:bacterioferritin